MQLITSHVFQLNELGTECAAESLPAEAKWRPTSTRSEHTQLQRAAARVHVRGAREVSHCLAKARQPAEASPRTWHALAVENEKVN